jgi:hypothetical protein
MWSGRMKVFGKENGSIEVCEMESERMKAFGKENGSIEVCDM